MRHDNGRHARRKPDGRPSPASIVGQKEGREECGEPEEHPLLLQGPLGSDRRTHEGHRECQDREKKRAKRNRRRFARRLERPDHNPLSSQGAATRTGGALPEFGKNCRPSAPLSPPCLGWARQRRLPSSTLGETRPDGILRQGLTYPSGSRLHRSHIRWTRLIPGVRRLHLLPRVVVARPLPLETPRRPARERGTRSNRGR